MGTLNGLCRFDGVEFTTFRHNSSDSLSIADNFVLSVVSDKNGLWVGTDRGMDFFSLKEHRFYHCKFVAEDGKVVAMNQQVKTIVAVAGNIFILDKWGRLYIRKEGWTFEMCKYERQYWYSISSYKDRLLLAHAYDGLYLIDVENQRIVSRSAQMAAGPSESLHYSTNSDRVYIGYGMNRPTEAYQIDSGFRIEKVYSNVPNDVDRMVDYEGETLFGTNGKGLVAFRETNIAFYTTANSSISSDVITALFVDRDDNLWVGTYRDGVNLYSVEFAWFKSLTVSHKQLTHKLVTGVAYLNNCFYLGLDGGGLDVYDSSSGKLLSSYTTANSSIIGNNVVSVENDGQYIWLADYYKNGICRFSPGNGTFKTYPFYWNRTWELKDDGNGTIWVIGQDVLLFDKHKENYTLIDTLKGVWASGIAFDKDVVWISTSGSGIYKLDRVTRTVRKHFSKGTGINPISEDVISYLFIDSKHQVWFSPRNSGVCKLDEVTGIVTSYGEKEGLMAANVTAISEDSAGYLWMGTDNGLFRFNPQSGTFVGFGKGDNLPSIHFNHSACFRKGDSLYFGSTNGLVYFNSREAGCNREVKPVYFRGIKLLNDEQIIRLDEEKCTETIVLPHNQNFFTIQFTSLEFVAPDKMRFSCRMENFEDEWREIKNAREVTYTNIPPGKYTFYVRALDCEGQWSNRLSCLYISIAPPWWYTNWAICLWMFLSVGILFLVYRVYCYQESIKRLAETEEAEKNLVKRDNEMKLRFFTNISHEFRTPLSLIISPLEILIKNETNASLRSQLVRIYKNADTLLALVNQLLDFRKLEMNGEKLNLTYGDLIEFVDIIFQTFKGKADDEHKDLILSVETEHLYMVFDKDKVRKVLNNLLSNAFKFTSEGDQISLILGKINEDGKGYAILRVSDTGIGIPSDKLSHVFERFYQLENETGCNTGSGIGLHIVKEYINMHHGKVRVESTLYQGTTFMVYIPLDLQLPGSQLLEVTDMEELQPDMCPIEITGRKKLLIVEDNNEFRQFLVGQLEADYFVIQAANGEEGESIALKELPDLIITDIMMPKIDGVELCKRIKNDIQTSHIPVILLTARASNEFILNGYEAGADEYISKPFSFELLLLQIQKLIKLQEERKIQFRNSIEIKPDDITITSLDEKLIQNALEAIERNLSNTEYSIDDLSSDVGLGRTNLYKKIQSITGKTPASFIRSVRLKKAAQMLCHSKLTVAEVADYAGFGNIKYFNRHFKEEFGMTPTQYRSQNIGLIDE